MDLPGFTDQWQLQRQQLFKSVPPEGRTVRYMDKEFLVYPNTFWPFADSLPLVRHFQVTPGESVLDVGTGSGVIGVFACDRGAARVVGVDINPAAIRSATHNARMHGFADTMEVRQSTFSTHWATSVSTSSRPICRFETSLRTMWWRCPSGTPTSGPTRASSKGSGAT